MGTIHHQTTPAGAQSWDFERVPVKEYTSGDATAGATRRVLLGDTWSEIGAGDAVFVEPNEQHQFEALSDAPLGFICVIPKWAKSQAATE